MKILNKKGRSFDRPFINLKKTSLSLSPFYAYILNTSLGITLESLTSSSGEGDGKVLVKTLLK